MVIATREDNTHRAAKSWEVEEGNGIIGGGDSEKSTRSGWEGIRLGKRKIAVRGSSGRVSRVRGG